MKKRWIPFIALTLVLIFAGGILLGSATEAEQQSEFWAYRIEIQNTIAVVNSDVGAVGTDGERRNYSAAIIQALEEEFTQASPAMAETGFLEGTFGAVITFPPHVSAGIMSFNQGSPQRVQLEFIINPNLTEREQIETFLRILNLQKSINTTLARSSVSSAFEQFHEAQEQVLDIFQNKEEGLVAMGIIELDEFTPSLNLDYLPENPFEANPFEGERHLSSVERFAASVASLFLGSYSQASSSFLSMREGLLLISDDLPQRASDWLENLEEWANEWEVYGESLKVDMGLATELVDEINLFIQELQDYLDDVDNFVGEINAYTLSLRGWHSDLSNRFDEQNDFYSRLGEDADDINSYVVERKNAYIRDLKDWHDNLSEGYAYLSGWLDSSVWLGLQNTRFGSLQSQVNTVGERPRREDFPEPPEEESPGYQAAVAAWHQNVMLVNTSVMILLGDLEGGLERLLPNIFDFELEEFPQYNHPYTPIGPAVLNVSLEELEWEVDEANQEEPDIEPFEEEVPETPDFYEPEIPEEGAPESAESFLEPLSDLRGQLDAFSMEDFLTADVLQGVEEVNASFVTYLDFVRDGLGFHVEGNNMLLSMIYFEYTNYLMGLRREIFAAETDEIAQLHQRLEEFYDEHRAIRLDTSTRLTDFSRVMPESRTEAGINREWIEHTITPFEFIPPVFRGDVAVEMFEGYSLVERFGRYFEVTVLLVLLVFLITLSSHFVSSKKNKEVNAKK